MIELEAQKTMQQESRNSIAELADKRAEQRQQASLSNNDVDDSDVEVEYTRD